MERQATKSCLRQLLSWGAEVVIGIVSGVDGVIAQWNLLFVVIVLGSVGVVVSTIIVYSSLSL